MKRMDMAVGAVVVALIGTVVYLQWPRTPNLMVRAKKTATLPDAPLTSYEWVDNASVVSIPQRATAPTPGTPAGTGVAATRLYLADKRTEPLSIQTGPTDQMGGNMQRPFGALIAVSADGTRAAGTRNAAFGGLEAWVSTTDGRAVAHWTLLPGSDFSSPMRMLAPAFIRWLPDMHHWVCVVEEMRAHTAHVLQLQCFLLSDRQEEKPVSRSWYINDPGAFMGYANMTTAVLPLPGDRLAVLRSVSSWGMPARPDAKPTLKLLTYGPDSELIPCRTTALRLPAKGQLLQAQISPSGDQVALMLCAFKTKVTHPTPNETRIETAGPTTYSLWVVGADGSHPRNLGELQGQQSPDRTHLPHDLRYRPDGKALSFAIGPDLYTIPVNGGA